MFYFIARYLSSNFNFWDKTYTNVDLNRTSMQRWQFSIYNDTLETLFWSIMQKIMSFSDSNLSLLLTSKKWASHYLAEKPQMKKKTITITLVSNSYLIKALVNRALSSLHGGSLEITLTVPLTWFYSTTLLNSQVWIFVNIFWSVYAPIINGVEFHVFYSIQGETWE